MALGNPARPIQLVVDGKKRDVLVRRLTDLDLTEITEWLRAEYVKTGRNGLGGLPEQQQDRLYLALVKDAMSVSIVSQKGREILGTHAGLARIMWHALRRDNPDLTPENVFSYMTSPENVQAANDYVRELASDPTRPARAGGAPRRRRSAATKSTAG